MEIYGIRSIIEAIESSKEISKVYLIKSSAQSSLLKSLLSLLEKKSIKYSFVPKERLNKYKNKNHQGAVAILSPISLLSIEELILKTYKENENKIYLLLDGITDTRNFSAPINSDVIKTSAGAAFKIPIARVNNLKDAVLHIISLGVKVYSLSEKSTKTIYDINYNQSVGLIMGSEDKGVSKGVIKLSDDILRIPISSSIDSLNVSAALSAVIFEIVRQRNFWGKKCNLVKN